MGNFNGGNSGVVSQPIIKIGDDLEGEYEYEVRRQFEGRFKQSFDATCYPYDHQEVQFEIAMDKPVNSYWTMYLLCSEGDVAKDAQGSEIQVSKKGSWPTNVGSCSKTLGTTTVGMQWNDFICNRTSASAITCSMTGSRSNGRIIITFLLPAILVTMMSFASFMLHVSNAMPRIATTMIAMLTLINLRNALARSLPGSGNLSWMEQYFMFSTIFMFLNLCCHIAAMSLHKRNLVLLSDFVDDVGCGVSFSLSVIIPFLLLASSGCTEEAMSIGLAATVIVFGFLFLAAVIIKSVNTKWDAIKAWKNSNAVCPVKPCMEDP